MYDQSRTLDMANSHHKTFNDESKLTMTYLLLFTLALTTYYFYPKKKKETYRDRFYKYNTQNKTIIEDVKLGED